MLAAFLLALAGCAAPAPRLNDPHEAANRKTHEMNKAFDQAVLRPIAGDGGGAAGAAVRNVADNLGLPNVVVNDLLQAKPAQAVSNTLRFAVNSTVGLGGILDPASAMGLTEKDNDFGHTLHVWGMGEGAYLELPLLGPSTERDLLGMVGDLFLDPLGPYLNRDQQLIALGLRAGAKASKRGEFAGTVDSILYDSADSYSQSRLLYLQNRRYELGQSTDAAADFLDPYEDPYAQ